MQGWEVDWHDGHVNLPSVCQICENTSVSLRWQAGSVPPGHSGASHGGECQGRPRLLGLVKEASRRALPEVPAQPRVVGPAAPCKQMSMG